MSETIPFQQALQGIEPLLRSMTQGFTQEPKASIQSLQQLLNTQPSKALSTSMTSALPHDHDDRLQKLAHLREEALACIRCPHLVASRTQVVFGVGNPFAELMFVGEAPGEEEDLKGEPFVGRAGQLLTKIINAMEYQREEIFIANVLKCRPNMPPNTSGNRKPKLEEMTTCLPWLKQQIELIKPRVLVALGTTAVEGLLGKAVLMRDMRGKWFDFQGTPLMVTYHPAYLLRNQSLSEKRKVWEDMLQVLEKLERPISEKQRGFFLSK
ncbi:MAG: uracil-DNA glycosylase [Verrucomicrobia bacterium RIFCSPHIGHO2_12_FULL_41_10]|nr:MAG: uracil-DNA glycosylase [Verrucomicrobia bacterium RIFCSPHIGHO2_12_FULL_41_10]HLB34716.1 uracil-DNA glycosylase [Chthoniobacterales bacterium]